MLTDLNFLNPGEIWPPASERGRLEMYARNKEIFEGNHTEVFADQFKRIERVIGNWQQVISYAVLTNYQKLISLKTADLLLGEFPRFKIDKSSSDEQKAVDNIIENSDLINTAYENTIDISRYGDGLFLVYKDSDSKTGSIDVTQPSIWFPIVSPDNLKKIKYHVLAWRYDVTENTNNGFFSSLIFGNNLVKQSFLKVQIHSKGSYEERKYQLDTGPTSFIGKLLSVDIVNTGLKDFAVINVPNVITSDRITGINDYDDLSSLLSELEVRLSQVCKILDKHAAPSVQGPSGAIEKDPQTGEWKLKMGNYFPRDSVDDPPLEYVTWEASLDANFKIIDKIINLLYVISEMGNTIFGDMDNKGSVGQLSGIALRRLMISPLAKVNRIRMRMDPALKKAIKLCSQLGGENIIDLTGKSLSIVWKDGLPQDEMEQANIMSIRTGGKPTISQYRAVQELDDLSAEDTQIEIDRIDEDESKVNPVGNGNFPFSSTAVTGDIEDQNTGGAE